jgi:hypothetical protein
MMQPIETTTTYLTSFNSQQNFQHNYMTSPIVFNSYNIPPLLNMDPNSQQIVETQNPYMMSNSGVAILTSSMIQPRQSLSSYASTSSIKSTSFRSYANPSRAYSNRTSNEFYFTNNSNASQQNLRRTKRGHVSKTRSSKRTSEINLHKSCPGCCKLWKNCKCSNIKNRPAPQPYCKFVPPRMLRKQAN